MSTGILVSGGNVHKQADAGEIVVPYLQMTGTEAEDLHAFIKLGRRQGLILTGAYKYKRFGKLLRGFNLKFSGPRDTLDALEGILETFNADD